jgi:SPP1 family predicted phage head-tail adaptor
MATVDAGRFKHRVKIEKRVSTQDTTGDTKFEWLDLGSVWADIRPLSGRKLESSQRLSPAVSHEIVVRYQAKYKDTKTMSTCRALHDDRIFNVLGCLILNEDNVLISLIAEEGLSEV